MWTKATWTADEDTLEQRKEFAEKKPTVLTREQAKAREKAVEEKLTKRVDKSGRNDIINTRGLGAKVGGNGLIPEHDEPVLVKVIDPADRESVFKELIDFEKSVVNEPIEHACVITGGGEVYHCFGIKDRVFIDYDLGDKLYGAFVSHNHTADETLYSFSNDDFKVFENYKLEVLRGRDKGYLYELNRSSLDVEIEPDNWQIFENVQHTRMIMLATDAGVGYRRWKYD